MFFPRIIFLKDSAGFSLFIEEYPFKCSSNYLLIFSERVYFFMDGNFDWGFLLLFPDNNFLLVVFA